MAASSATGAIAGSARDILGPMYNLPIPRDANPPDEATRKRRLIVGVFAGGAAGGFVGMLAGAAGPGGGAQGAGLFGMAGVALGAFAGGLIGYRSNR